MGKNLFIFLSISLFSITNAYSVISKNYYVGVKDSQGFNSLKESQLITIVLKEFKTLKVLKVRSSNPEKISELSYVDFVERSKKSVSILAKNKIEEVEVEEVEVEEEEAEEEAEEEGAALDEEVKSNAKPEIMGEVPWGVDKIRAPRVWKEFEVSGEGIKILVLDTGIQEDHPAIKDRIIKARDFTGTVVNKYVPKAYHDIGGHGTHVSATIVGNGFNKIYGVAPSAGILVGKVCKFLCDVDAVIAGLEWGIEERVDVINLSLSSPSAPIKTYKRAFKMLEDNNTLAVSSAGNRGRTQGHKIANPAAIDTVLAVGASDHDDFVTEFSSKGRDLDLLAPGLDILSASPVKGPEATPNLIRALSGTSMATPHVSGVGALLKELRPDLHVSAIREIIKASALKTPEAISMPLLYGNGILDVYSAFELSLLYKRGY